MERHAALATTEGLAALVPLGHAVEGLRVAKDDEELALLARACQITGQAFDQTVTRIRAGMTEHELAVLIERAMVDAGYARPIDVSSTRAGAIPGTHEIGFDGPSESVTLTHSVRDRAVFALGALDAAQWIRGRKGWFSIADMLK